MFKYFFDFMKKTLNHINKKFNIKKRDQSLSTAILKQIEASKIIKTKKEIEQQYLTNIISEYEKMKTDGLITDYRIVGDTVFLQYNKPIDYIKLNIKVDKNGGK